MRIPTLFLAALLTVSAQAASPVTYRVDQAASEVTARVAFFGLASKTAKFPEMTGQVRLDPARPSAITLDVTLDARALEAPDDVTLRRLKSEKFFWVDRYPTVRFVGTGFRMADEGSGTVEGRLTARGVTRPVTLDVAFDRPVSAIEPGTAFRIEGETTIDRRDFGMTAYRFIVGKEVTIRLRAALRPR